MTARFIGIQYPGKHPVAAFAGPLWSGGKEFVLNEDSLRTRIMNLERLGLDVTQETIALKALVEASK